MTWNEIYDSKVIGVDEALHLVRSGMNVAFSAGICAPFSVLRRFHEVRQWATRLHILTSTACEEFPYLVTPEYRDTFSTDVVFASAPDRLAFARGTASYLPAHLNRSAEVWCENNPVDIFFGSCSPMDEHGCVHLGPCLKLEYAAAHAAKAVVLECNPNIPVVYGQTGIHVSQVAHFIQSEWKMPLGPAPLVDPRLDDLGSYIAELIHDGDCIQLGIGAIPDAVASKLMTKHDLGIHTEMITSAMANLAEAGVVTGRKKNFHPNKIVGVFAVGDQHLYDFLDHNTMVEFLPTAYAVDPMVIAQNDNMVSVNTCFSCDLTGQVSSEALGTHQYCGTGGQASTAIGAVRAKNGRSIIAMRSTTHTKNGVVSNITAVHPAGTVISLQRNDVDYVVTEYGAARLRGKSIRDRVDSLIAIAHPDYRAELRKDAERLHLKY
jgi:acyl-CoA hydrolase